MDDGDLYAYLFPREQKGRIRGLGLLPSGSKSIALARTIGVMRQMEEENAQLKARMESAERKAELNEQNYNELKSMVLAIQGSSPGVGSIDACNGSPRVGSVDAHHGSPGVGSSGAHKGPGYVSPNIVEQSDGVDKGVVGASKHQRTTVHHNRQTEANGQQLQSLSSDNGVHVDELNKTRAKKV